MKFLPSMRVSSPHPTRDTRKFMELTNTSETINGHEQVETTLNPGWFEKTQRVPSLNLYQPQTMIPKEDHMATPFIFQAQGCLCRHTIVAMLQRAYSCRNKSSTGKDLRFCQGGVVKDYYCLLYSPTLFVLKLDVKFWQEHG